MFTGIEHFAIASSNPKLVADWYVEHLEFHINYEYGGNYFVKAKNGFVIEIIPSEGDRGPNGFRTPGLRHIAISVENFDAAYAALKDKGVSFLGEPYMNQTNRLVFFTDPEGNQIHLIERETPLP
jgi:glyoxylase I family protein